VQSTPINTAVQAPFSVESFDATGNATPGTPVIFEILTPGCGTFNGGATVVWAQTNIDGHATAPAFTVGSSTAKCVVRASLAMGMGTINSPPSPIFQDFVVNPYNPASGSTPFAMTVSAQDMWWVGPSENGWGMSLIQHNDIIFAALYIYGASGNPTWLVMPGGSWDSTHAIYQGSLYEPSGSPFYAYDTTKFVAGNARGTITVAFTDSNNATLQYTIDGVTGSKSISREIFADGAANGTNHSDLWWGGTSQDGWGITVLQQASTLFAVWYTYDASGKPIWYVIPDGAWDGSGVTYSGTLYRTTGSPWLGATYDPSKVNVVNAGTYSFTFGGDGATFRYSADGHSGSVPLVGEPF
jgi:hypothetical protein